MPAARHGTGYPYAVWVRVTDWSKPNKPKPYGAQRLLSTFPDAVLEEAERMTVNGSNGFVLRTTRQGLAVLLIRAKDAQSFKVLGRSIANRAKALGLHLTVNDATKPAQRVIEQGI